MGTLEITIVIVAVVMMALYGYFIVRPELKGRYRHTFMIDGLKVGDKVELISGLRGIVCAIDRDNNTMDIDCEGVYFEYNLASLMNIIEVNEDRATPYIAPEFE